MKVVFGWTFLIAKRKSNQLVDATTNPTQTSTKLMKAQGYSDGYIYDHDTPEGFSGLDYFPEDVERERFYDPPERGFEREIKKRLEYWAKRRN